MKNPDQVHTACSIYIKFQEIKTNIQKQKADLWLLGAGGRGTVRDTGEGLPRGDF